MTSFLSHAIKKYLRTYWPKTMKKTSSNNQQMKNTQGFIFQKAVVTSTGIASLGTTHTQLSTNLLKNINSSRSTNILNFDFKLLNHSLTH